MDGHTTTLFTLIRHHTRRILDELAINAHAHWPEYYILAAALNAQGVACQLRGELLDSDDVSTMVVVLRFPSGEVINYAGLKGWPAIEAEVIHNLGGPSGPYQWIEVAPYLIQSMMAKELSDVGEDRLDQISCQVIAAVRAEVLQTQTAITRQSKPGSLRL